MPLADTAAVADLGVFKHGNAVEGIFLAGNNLTELKGIITSGQQCNSTYNRQNFKLTIFHFYMTTWMIQIWLNILYL